MINPLDHAQAIMGLEAQAAEIAQLRLEIKAARAVVELAKVLAGRMMSLWPIDDHPKSETLKALGVLVKALAAYDAAVKGCGDGKCTPT